MPPTGLFEFTHGEQVRVRAGLQLVAHFPGDLDALEVLRMVQKLAAEALGSESAVTLEAAIGCVHVYITFVDDNLSIGSLTLGLRRNGARITFVEDPDGRFGYMTLVRRGVLHPSRANMSHPTVLFTLLITFYRVSFHVLGEGMRALEHLLEICGHG